MTAGALGARSVPGIGLDSRADDTVVRGGDHGDV